MRKGFFASVAALASGAGVALGQGVPNAAPAAPPSAAPWGGPGAPAPMSGDPNAFLGGPAYPGAASPTSVPPAGEMPLYGQVPGPNCEHPLNPGAAPEYPTPTQVHKAAGGPDRWWLEPEENIWTVRSMPFAYPLLTMGPLGSTGGLGQNGVSVLYGDKDENYGKTFNVFRLTGGLWDECRIYGLELSGFISEQRTDNLDIAIPVTGQNVLSRPFVNSLTNTNTGLLIASPPTFGGQVHIGAELHMGGAEANVLRNLIYCDMVKVNLLGGFRYVDLSESLDISSTTGLPNGNTSAISDEFRTHNQFIGGQLGLETELRRGRFFVDMTGKVAVGNMHERLSVDGDTTLVAGSTVTTTQGGLLALNSNIGNSTRNEFACVPEGTVKFGYQWTQRISTYIGVNGLYLSRVMRPGEQIDPDVNPVELPVSNQFGGVFGQPRPLPVNRQSDFWAAGATLGLSIRY